MNSLERLKIAFSYGVVGQTTTAVPVYVVIKMTGSSSDRYATYAIDGTGRIYLTWTSSVTFLQLGGAKNNGGAIAYDNIPCNDNWNNWQEQLKRFDLLTDDIELAGDLELRFFLCLIHKIHSYQDLFGQK